MKTPAYAITHLMARYLPHGIRFKPEEQICFHFAETMRRLTSTSEYNGVWFHVASEGNRGKITNLMLMALGMIRGTPDYAFMWPSGCGLIEFKTPERMRINNQQKLVKARATVQSREQVYFQRWCEQAGVKYAVCRSTDEALAMLKAWGALK